MKEGLKKQLNIYLNICLLLLIGVATYSWMLTEPEVGENLRYQRNLIISSSTISVKIYEYVDNEYVEILNSPFDIKYVAPGVNTQFKFEISNNKNYTTSTNIIFSGITGDIAALSDNLYFNTTSPTAISKNLGRDIIYNATSDVYYMVFLRNFQVPANQTISVYWNVNIDERAANEVASKMLTIDHIAFIKP